MLSTRRSFLSLLAAAGIAPAAGRASFCRQYVASATITVLSLPLVSRSGVGSGFAEIEENGHSVSIRFGAGSFPETARGLNRLGFIEETVTEARPGDPEEARYFAFMTTSQEKSLDEAKQAVEQSGATVPYSTAEARGTRAGFTSRVDRVTFPAQYTFRDLEALGAKARAFIAASTAPERTAEGAPATFLYCVRRAMLNPESQSSAVFFFNSKEFELRTTKTRDASMGRRLAERGVVPQKACVTRIQAMLTERARGIETPFRLWYEEGKACAPPVRFEYQAKSFLKLAFEAQSARRTS